LRLKSFFRKELMNTDDEKKSKMLRIMIEEVEDCPPFSALGFYTIDRSTLTATLGTILTYFIILFQTLTC
jgi:hypothetical protein